MVETFFQRNQRWFYTTSTKKNMKIPQRKIIYRKCSRIKEKHLDVLFSPFGFWSNYLCVCILIRRSNYFATLNNKPKCISLLLLCRINYYSTTSQLNKSCVTCLDDYHTNEFSCNKNKLAWNYCDFNHNNMCFTFYLSWTNSTPYRAVREYTSVRRAFNDYVIAMKPLI